MNNGSHYGLLKPPKWLYKTLPTYNFKTAFCIWAALGEFECGLKTENGETAFSLLTVLIPSVMTAFWEIKMWFWSGVLTEKVAQAKEENLNMTQMLDQTLMELNNLWSGSAGVTPHKQHLIRPCPSHCSHQSTITFVRYMWPFCRSRTLLLYCGPLYRQAVSVNWCYTPPQQGLKMQTSRNVSGPNVFFTQIQSADFVLKYCMSCL